MDLALSYCLALRILWHISLHACILLFFFFTFLCILRVAEDGSLGLSSRNPLIFRFCFFSPLCHFSVQFERSRILNSRFLWVRVIFNGVDIYQALDRSGFPFTFTMHAARQWSSVWVAPFWWTPPAFWVYSAFTVMFMISFLLLYPPTLNDFWWIHRLLCYDLYMYLTTLSSLFILCSFLGYGILSR